VRSVEVTTLVGEVDEKLLALTFDDGPSDWTMPIADAFAARGGHATFFVIGRAVSGREATVRAVAAQGHEIGNHSLTHPSLAGLDRATLRDELRRTNERIEDVLGRPPVLLRPPYVEWDEAVLDVAGELGLRWTVCTAPEPTDWVMSSPEEIAREVLARVAPGSIVGLHDGRPEREPPSKSLPTREATATAVELVLSELAGEYRLVTVLELLAAAGRADAASLALRGDGMAEDVRADDPRSGR
jgi:peptidoglycan/xylan/chitin deacetylase (PgdA/CDA1 family)